MANIGFTGTRRGMTTAQKAVVELLLRRFIVDSIGTRHAAEDLTLHHGCCVGADEEAHDIVTDRLHSLTVGHPPTNTKHMSDRQCCATREPKPYRIRNRQIVLATEALIATPLDDIEQTYSGTWVTIRIARGLHKPIYIVFPNGTVRTEAVSEILPEEITNG